MSLFDTVFKPIDEQKPTKNQKSQTVYDSNAAMNAQSGPNESSALPTPVKPQSFDDVYALLKKLKLGQAIAVDCSELKETTAIRVLDILSGAAYALNGTWRTYGSEIFLFALDNAFKSL